MLTVLLVDDDEFVRKWVCTVLSAFDCDVIEASAASQALKILETQRVDVLFSDCVMPGEMSGPDLAMITAALYPEMRIILMSGCYEQDLRLPDGWKFLRKPFKPSDIRRAVDPDIGTQPTRTGTGLSAR
jgi:DNA-binding NtrC family response regulator